MAAILSQPQIPEYLQISWMAIKKNKFVFTSITLWFHVGLLGLKQ